MRQASIGFGFAVFVLGIVPSCGGGKDDSVLIARINEANDKVMACEKDGSKLKDDIGALKRQLAEAMANPSKIALTDPEIIELVASVKAARAAAPGAVKPIEDIKLGKGDLNPRDASRVVMAGAQGLQVCYEHALKKNSSLQYQAGIKLVLGITVRGNGAVQGVDVTPSVDHEMTACIKSAAARWKFPTFGAQAVTIEQTVSLSPKV